MPEMDAGNEPVNVARNNKRCDEAENKVNLNVGSESWQQSAEEKAAKNQVHEVQKEKGIDVITIDIRALEQCPMGELK